ncbi:MAG: NAD(P)/FAD-dependent oxidoreductase [Candidatus Thorarchaeota archaeon]
MIIGYGPGGVGAAFAARAFSKDVEITILTQEIYEAHRKPGVSLALEYPETQELMITDWSYDALSDKGIKVVSGVTVYEANCTSKTLKLKSNNGDSSELTYDKLIIATGGVPAIPNIPGNDLEGIFTIQDMSDTSEIGTKLSGMNSIVIIGAGFSGLEIAERLLHLGKKVHLIIRSRLMRKLLEEPMSEELMNRLPTKLQIHQGAAPDKIVGAGAVEGVSIANQVIPADAVLFMTGVKPNTKLASTFGVELGTLGGIKVNDQMETSLSGVYAVGDCVEMTDMMTSKPMLIPVGSVAARSGRQAGVAAVGGTKIYEDKSLKFQYDSLFGNDVVCVGHSSIAAKEQGLTAKIHYLEDKAEHMKVALITNEDGTLIGGQVISSRMGARVGYQILDRLKSKAVLDESPLLASRHKQIKDLLEQTLGPIQ